MKFLSNILYDFEFYHAGGYVPIVPISIGATNQEGDKAYHAVFKDQVAKLRRIPEFCADEWIAEHVMAKLPEESSPEWKSDEDIRSDVFDFLKQNGGSLTQVWARNGSTDFVCLFSLFNTMMDMNAEFKAVDMRIKPRDVNELKRILGTVDVPDGDPGLLHGADYDAEQERLLLVAYHDKYGDTDLGHRLALVDRAP